MVRRRVSTWWFKPSFTPIIREWIGLKLRMDWAQVDAVAIASLSRMALSHLVINAVKFIQSISTTASGTVMAFHLVLVVGTMQCVNQAPVTQMFVGELPNGLHA